jgi:hypothetical protein
MKNADKPKYYTVALPPETHEKLLKLAHADYRTLKAQIEFLVDEELARVGKC